MIIDVTERWPDPKGVYVIPTLTELLDHVVPDYPDVTAVRMTRDQLRVYGSLVAANVTLAPTLLGIPIEVV